MAGESHLSTARCQAAPFPPPSQSEPGCPVLCGSLWNDCLPPSAPQMPKRNVLGRTWAAECSSDFQGRRLLSGGTSMKASKNM